MSVEEPCNTYNLRFILGNALLLILIFPVHLAAYKTVYDPQTVSEMSKQQKLLFLESYGNHNVRV